MMMRMMTTAPPPMYMLKLPGISPNCPRRQRWATGLLPRTMPLGALSDGIADTVRLLGNITKLRGYEAKILKGWVGSTQGRPEIPKQGKAGSFQSRLNSLRNCPKARCFAPLNMKMGCVARPTHGACSRVVG